MPFHRHHRRSSSSANVQDASLNTPSAVGGVLQATQILGSVGAVAGNLRVPPSSTTSVGTDGLLFANSHSTGLNGDTNSTSIRASELIDGAGRPGAWISGSAVAESSQPFDGPRRVPTLARQPEELHIPTTNKSMGSN